MDFQKLKNQIAKVNEVFYDLVYKDPWLGLVFQGTDQDHIARQQTDFMLGAFGGPKIYAGRSPKDAHPHININEEMWDLREKHLRAAFVKTNFPPDLQVKWIRIDEAFKQAILKKSVADCQKRFNLDVIIDPPKPGVKKVG